ncbi:MAG: alpha-amylase family glycosyl hydrolase [Streptosporangiaceae bacterium]
MSDVPSGTYRLQLRPGFGFAEAAEQAGYLAALGVSHVYLSPILQAVPGSSHGYDVLDHSHISAELGGEDGFRALAAELNKHGLGVVVDVVPNHMAFVEQALAPQLASVLELGRDSPFADWFDIDWDASDVLVPPGKGEPNYRRFFDISGLIALRQEEPGVFEATHGLLLRLHEEGLIDGFRIDHPDGLSDPRGYLSRLSERTGGAWTVVEKILTGDEELPADWPCAGTTGYEMIGAVGGVFTDPAGEEPLTDLYRERVGPAAYREVELESRRHAAAHGLAPEIRRLQRELFDKLIDFPTYRSYGQPEDWNDLIVRFQQTTAPLAARGAEDTAFYRWSRFVALNEVGGDPAAFSLSPAEFEAFCARQARDWPASMTTLSTHDTKRQEDVRARLAVLAEQPGHWAEFSRPADSPLDPDLDYLLWQTLVGAWPLDADRLEEYMTKVMREAKTHTTWTEQNPAYEAAVLGHVRDLLADPAVTGAVEEFVTLLHPYERVNVLGQKLLQLTMPGVPDLYQGCELTGWALVDPDNRRPVDYARRATMLAALDAGIAPQILDEEKLLVTSRALRLRRQHPDWFASSFTPLRAVGRAAQHVLAFERGGAITVATRLPYGLADKGGWAGTVLSPGRGPWQDVLTGRTFDGPDLDLADLLGRLPVALLIPLEG